MDLIKGAWNGLSKRGRTIVLVTVIAVVGVIALATIAYKYDWTWAAQFIH
jgi:hypothetical protein